MPESDLPPPPGSALAGSGSENDLHERISALEDAFKNLATKEDLRRLEASISRRLLSLRRRFIGAFVGIILGLGVVLLMEEIILNT